nr:creatininase family protein [Clostridium sp. Marseille-Q2269]
MLRGISSKDAPFIAEVLLEEGINWIEVSLSDEKEGIASIDEIYKNFKNSDINLGVGTVINKDQVSKYLEVGAKYIITPGFDRELVRYVNRLNVSILPGVFTAGEVAQAMAEKIDICKLFPANILGFDYINSLKDPFPNMKFVAVGGVNIKNINYFLENGFYAVGIGSDLVPGGSSKQDKEYVRNNAKEYIKVIKKRMIFMKNKYEMINMTRDEIKDSFKKTSVAVLPIGALEQHGHHLPLGTDIIIAEELGRRVCEETEALLLPAIPFGYSWVWRNIPGTITLKQHNVEEIIKDTASSLDRYGVKNLIVINDMMLIMLL